MVETSSQILTTKFSNEKTSPPPHQKQKLHPKPPTEALQNPKRPPLKNPIIQREAAHATSGLASEQIVPETSRDFVGLNLVAEFIQTQVLL